MLVINCMIEKHVSEMRARTRWHNDTPSLSRQAGALSDTHDINHTQARFFWTIILGTQPVIAGRSLHPRGAHKSGEKGRSLRLMGAGGPRRTSQGLESRHCSPSLYLHVALVLGRLHGYLALPPTLSSECHGSKPAARMYQTFVNSSEVNGCCHDGHSDSQDGKEKLRAAYTEDTQLKVCKIRLIIDGNKAYNRW